MLPDSHYSQRENYMIKTLNGSFFEHLNYRGAQGL